MSRIALLALIGGLVLLLSLRPSDRRSEASTDLWDWTDWADWADPPEAL